MPVIPVEYRTLDWLELPHYRVGDDGSVWSRYNNRWGLGDWKRLKIHRGTDARGRQGKTTQANVGLRKDGKYLWIIVSRLVLEAFVGQCPEGMEACHFPDSNPMNNNLENLRWDTPRSNSLDKKVHGTWDACHGTGDKNPHHSITNEEALEMRQLRLEKNLTYKQLAQRFNISVMTAWNIVNKKTYKDVQSPSSKDATYAG